MRSCFKILSVPALLLVMSVAVAQPLQVTDGWVRWLPGDIPAGAYFTLHNNTDATVELSGASAPGYGKVMLHKSVHSDGTARMVGVKSIKVKPGATLEFAPGGYHIMLMKPHNDLKPGDTLPVTLIFADGAHLTQKFDVRNATGQ